MSMRKTDSPCKATVQARAAGTDGTVAGKRCAGTAGTTPAGPPQQTAGTTPSRRSVVRKHIKLKSLSIF